MANFDELLEMYAGSALAGLILFQEAVAERPWQFETESGVLAFGDDLRFDAQILATESFQSPTFQWAWANEESDLPEAATEYSRRLRAFGLERELVEFTGSRAAFPAEHEHGVVHLLVPDPGEHVAPRRDPEFLTGVIGEMLETVSIFHHRPAVRSFLEANEYVLSEQGEDSRIVARSEHGALELKFDDEDRVVEITTDPG